MKKRTHFVFMLLVLSLSIISLNSCKKDLSLSQEEYYEFSILSEETHDSYDINVLFPEDYDEQKKYHSIYMLDGDEYFYEAASMIKENKYQNIVLIAIGYTNKNERGRDLSYPEDTNISGMSGGGKNFTKFLNNELIPYIENSLQLNSIDMTLYGHSLGGFYALYYMLQQEEPRMFDNYISISANFMWSDAYIFELEQLYSDQFNALPAKLFLSVGDLEGAAINTHYQAFLDQLQKHSYFDFELSHQRLNNTSHRNSPIVGIEKGILELF
ncbi:alpha/beta hydrolase [Brumimicrobium aurantiacum]|uniref:Alpha/beta hydrolase n=1 Tax=Brumimicrobium aurantiacum TaxID=1737063 RepID=A0A3E1EVE4_9FLAO|nr:alpha/beta hydrolase-fold protein [Brumimicrobium aurantiacum]RFC53536.1 alpha/beta hydrolase [Brumimicrobium aurantiacum]